MKPDFNVPFIDLFKRKRRSKGDCLAHCPLMLKVNRLAADNKKRNPYVVAMGHVNFLNMPFRHCWLETKSIVVDLTRPQKFFRRIDYYDLMKINSEDVFRYTYKEMIHGLVRNGCWTFGDVPPGAADALRGFDDDVSEEAGVKKKDLKKPAAAKKKRQIPRRKTTAKSSRR